MKVSFVCWKWSLEVSETERKRPVSSLEAARKTDAMRTQEFPTSLEAARKTEAIKTQEFPKA